MPDTYLAEVSGGWLWTDNLRTGQRTLITTVGDPSNPSITADGWVIWDQPTGGRLAAPADGSRAPGPLRTDVSQIVLWGDSTTAANATDYRQGVADALGVTLASNQNQIINMGWSGKTSSDIAVRQGGLKVACTLPGNQIPTQGLDGLPAYKPEDDAGFLTKAVQIAAAPATSWRDGPNGGTPLVYWHGTLAGVNGYLAHDRNNSLWYFARDVSGAAVACPSGSNFGAIDAVDSRDVRQQLEPLRDKLHVIWLGRNNLTRAHTTPVFTSITPDDIIRDTAAMVDYLTPYVKRYIVMGPYSPPEEPAGSDNYNALRAVNAQLAVLYPGRYIDIHRKLVNEGLAKCGLTPTSDDLADIATDTVPRQLLKDDIFHPTTTCQRQAIGFWVREFVRSKKWRM